MTQSVFLMNVALAFVWSFLGGQQTMGNFAIGYILGFVLLSLFPVFRSTYTRRVQATFKFILIFIREWLMSNLAVASVILDPKMKKLKPGFAELSVAGLTRMETLILSHCITLTPGTTSVKFMPDGNTLLVHSLFADSPTLISDIETHFKNNLLECTR
jgi:multisubunit Na+/H+ antiporter MnhE subunit